MQEINIIEYSKNQLLSEYSDSAIEILSRKYQRLTADNGTSFVLVKKALADVRNRRVSIEKRRKEIKDPLITAGKELDNEAKRLTSLLKNIETPLLEEKNNYDAKLEAIKAEKAKIEAVRIEKINERINHFGAFSQDIFNKTSVELRKKYTELKADMKSDAFDYGELQNQAFETKLKTGGDLERAIKQQEEIEKERAELEKERAKEAAERAKLEEAAKKVELERAAEREKLEEALEQVKQMELEKERLEKEKKRAAEREKLEEVVEAIEEPKIAGEGQDVNLSKSTKELSETLKAWDNMFNSDDDFVFQLATAFNEGSFSEKARIKEAFQDYWDVFLINDKECVSEFLKKRRD